MDTKNQFIIFLLCVCIGFVAGILYEALSFLFVPFTRKGKAYILRAIKDVLFWLIFTIFVVFISHVLQVPSLRGYMWLGYVLGGILYLKTLRRIVAFCKKICYNTYIKRRQRQENKGEPDNG